MPSLSSCTGLKSIHPWPFHIKNPSPPEGVEYEDHFYVGLIFEPPASATNTAASASSSGANTNAATNAQVAQQEAPRVLAAPLKREFDMSGSVNYFIAMVNDYDTKEEGMTMEISHVKSKKLPEFVFIDDRRPEGYKRKKKRKKKSAATAVTATAVAKEETKGEVKEEVKQTPIKTEVAVGMETVKTEPVVKQEEGATTLKRKAAEDPATLKGDAPSELKRVKVEAVAVVKQEETV